MKKLLLLSTLLLLNTILSAQWIQQNPNYPDTNTLNSIYFIDEYNGWTGGSSDDNWVGPSFYSNDAGNTWDFMWILQSINGIYFTDANKGWAVGDNGQISYTNDGGSNADSWEYQESNTQYDLASVFFLDSLKGWAVGIGYYGWFESELIYTTDGGNAWTNIGNPFGDGIQDISFTDENTGYAVGKYFHYTSDGGMTWESQLFGTYSTQGMAFCIVDENNMWIAGYEVYGVIYNSNDGGNTWESLLGDTIPWLNDITFVCEYIGWAVGNEGTILHTFDGGLTWEYQESVTQADLFSISFADENHGWICGDSCVILYTDNIGTTAIQAQPLKSNIEVDINPNPLSEICTLELELNSPKRISIMVFSSSGQKVFEYESEQMNSLTKPFQINMTEYAEGLYYTRIQVGNESITKKIIKL